MDGELCTELWEGQLQGLRRGGGVGLEERVQAFLWVGRA